MQIFHEYGSVQNRDVGKDRALNCNLRADQLILDGSRSRYESRRENVISDLLPSLRNPQLRGERNRRARKARSGIVYTHTKSGSCLIPIS